MVGIVWTTVDVIGWSGYQPVPTHSVVFMYFILADWLAGLKY